MVVRLITVALLALACAPAAHGQPAPSVYMLDEDFAGADPAAAARLAAATGVREIRKDFLWRAIEPHPGEMDWRTADPAVAAAARAGLDLVPTLVSAPAWAQDPALAGLPGIVPPADPADFARFAAAAAARYGPGGAFWKQHPELPQRPVRAWQVWNEPNIGAFWRPAPDAFAYAKLLIASAAAIRAADAGAEIIHAGLPDALGGVPPAQFLSHVYNAGGAAAFDTLAVHPYAPDATSALAAVSRLRAAADGAGDRDTPLRVTEFGWATKGEPSLFTTDEATQAALVGEAVYALRENAQRLRLKGFVYFKWRDHPPPASARDIWPYHAGLLRVDGTAKPALAAFATALAEPLPAPSDPGPAPGDTGGTTPSGGDGPGAGQAPPAAMRVRARVPRQSARGAGRRGLRVRTTCSVSCRVSVTVSLETPGSVRRVRRIVGRATGSLVDGTVVVRVKPADLRRARAKAARLVVRVSGRTANEAVEAKSVRLRMIRGVFRPS